MEELALHKRMVAASAALAVVYTAFHFYTAGFGILAGLEQRVLHLGVGIALVFLAGGIPPRPRTNRALAVDMFLALLTIAATIYALVIGNAAMTKRAGLVLPADVVFGTIMIVTLLEATRRVVGLAIPLVSAVALLYAVLGGYLPGIFANRGYSWSRVMQQVFLSYEGLFSLPIGASATYIAAFLIFAGFLQKIGAGKFLTDLSLSAFGKIRGGPAKMATVGSALFGSVSGSVSANIVGTGSFTIPLMKKTGYSPEFAAGVEATASTGGQLMPPIMGTAAFLMADFLGRPYSYVAKAALLPALLFYTAIFVAVDITAVKNGLFGLRDAEVPKARDILKSGWMYGIPVLVLIYLMFVVKTSTMNVAFWSSVSVIAVSYFKKSDAVTPRRFISMLKEIGPGIARVALTCASAGLVLGVFSLTGLGFKLSSALVTLAGGNQLRLLVLSMVASIILGMGLPTTPSYILLAVLVVPVLIRTGVVPVAAHLFIFYFGMLSHITPPVSPGSYTAAGLAGSNPMRTAWEAIKIAIPGYIIPYIMVYNPALVLEEPTAFSLCVGFLSSLAGITATAFATQGYCCRILPAVDRVLFLVSGALLLDPRYWTDMIGVVLLVLMVIYEKSRSKSTQRPGVAVGGSQRKWRECQCLKQEN